MILLLLNKVSIFYITIVHCTLALNCFRLFRSSVVGRRSLSLEDNQACDGVSVVRGAFSPSIIETALCHRLHHLFLCRCCHEKMLHDASRVSRGVTISIYPHSATPPPLETSTQAIQHQHNCREENQGTVSHRIQ
jgi:hypothetical protein